MNPRQCELRTNLLIALAGALWAAGCVSTPDESTVKAPNRPFDVAGYENAADNAVGLSCVTSEGEYIPVGETTSHATRHYARWGVDWYPWRTSVDVPADCWRDPWKGWTVRRHLTWADVYKHGEIDSEHEALWSNEIFVELAANAAYWWEEREQSCVNEQEGWIDAVHECGGEPTGRLWYRPFDSSPRIQFRSACDASSSVVADMQPGSTACMQVGATGVSFIHVPEGFNAVIYERDDCRGALTVVEGDVDLCTTRLDNDHGANDNVRSFQLRPYVDW